MMKSIFLRRLKDERELILISNLSDEDKIKMMNYYDEMISFQNDMIYLERIMNNSRISKEMKKIQFNLIFEIHKDNEYIKENYQIQKEESEIEIINIAYDLYKEFIFFEILDNHISLRDIY